MGDLPGSTGICPCGNAAIDHGRRPAVDIQHLSWLNDERRKLRALLGETLQGKEEINGEWLMRLGAMRGRIREALR